MAFQWNGKNLLLRQKDILTKPYALTLSVNPPTTQYGILNSEWLALLKSNTVNILTAFASCFIQESR